MPQHNPSPGATLALSKVIVVTQNTTLTPQANGAVVSNKGAAGAVRVDLPAPALGLSFTFMLSVSETLTLNPGTFGILWSGGLYSSLANGSWGNGIQLIGDGDHWVAPFSTGAWG